MLLWSHSHGLGSVGSLAGAAAKHGAFNGGSIGDEAKRMTLKMHVICMYTHDCILSEKPLEVPGCFGHVSMRMRDIINVSHRSTSLHEFESFLPLVKFAPTDSPAFQIPLHLMPLEECTAPCTTCVGKSAALRSRSIGTLHRS